MDKIAYKKKVKDKKRVYEITWSNYIKGSKFNILKFFTEMTGVFVVFYVNKYKRLAPLIVGGAWFTGLRPTLLKLYNRLSVDVLPDHLYNKLNNEKIFIKYIEIYELSDFTDILYDLKTKYPQAFFDSNGIPPPIDLNNVKTIDINTRIYYKNNIKTDI